MADYVEFNNVESGPHLDHRRSTPALEITPLGSCTAELEREPRGR
jgi:hypothetical protein